MTQKALYPLSCIIRLFKSSLSIRVSAPHLQDDHQQASAHEQRDEAANEPAKPEDAIVQAHDPHGLLQACLLLIHNALDNHSHRVNPGQGHEEGH